MHRRTEIKAAEEESTTEHSKGSLSLPPFARSLKGSDNIERSALLCY